MSDEVNPGKGRCSVGSGGNWEIAGSSTAPGCNHPRHLIWLPSGFGPCEGQLIMALVSTPFQNHLLDKQLAEAVSETIEKFIWAAARRHRPIKERGWRIVPVDANEK